MNGLFNSTTLDVIVGLVFVYLLLAVVCTTINEWLAGVFGLRSKNLTAAIKQLLDSQPGTPGGDADWLLKQFYLHPLITGMLHPGDNSNPTYLPARTFATVLMDLVTPKIQGTINFGDFENGVKDLPDGDVKKALLGLLQSTRGDLAIAQANIENWFDDTMDRASGWYKRKTQLVTVFIAVLVTVGANADTMKIVSTLWRNPTTRAIVLDRAQKKGDEASITASYPDKDKPRDPIITKSAEKVDLDDLGEVIGWSQSVPNDAKGCLQKLLGWFLTIVAISLGAPFWFDVLNKVMNIRNSGKKPEKSETQPQLQAHPSTGVTDAKTL
jgi:hypothetical protein